MTKNENKLDKSKEKNENFLDKREEKIQRFWSDNLIYCRSNEKTGFK